MPKQPLSVGAFMASITEQERAMLTQAQDKLCAERSLGLGPQETIEMPLQWCQEALEMHRRGQVSSKGLAVALEWSLQHPTEVISIAHVVREHGMLHLHEKGNPEGDLQTLADHYAAWRETFASDPVKAVREATRAVMIAGRGKSNPAVVQQVIQAFFSEPGDTPMHPWAKRLLPQPRKILTDENFRPELTRALAQLGSTADLNHLDVSNVTSMKDAFRLMFFQGDISHWDVSNVEDMSGMFTQCSFNGDISKWNTRNVRTMAHMFQSSKFNGNISGWDTGRVTSMMRMFESSSFNGDVSRWDVQNVQTFHAMFQKSPFCGDVSKWKWANAAHVGYMFHETPWRGEVPFLRYRPGMEFSWFFSNEKAHEFREPNFYHWFLALAQPNNPDLRLDWKLFSQLVPTGPDLKEKARATCAIQDLWEKGAPVQQESFEHDFEGPA